MATDMRGKNKRTGPILQKVLVRAADIVKQRIIRSKQQEKNMSYPFSECGIDKPFHPASCLQGI
jgi:hypothetical protein